MQHCISALSREVVGEVALAGNMGYFNGVGSNGTILRDLPTSSWRPARHRRLFLTAVVDWQAASSSRRLGSPVGRSLTLSPMRSSDVSSSVFRLADYRFTCNSQFHLLSSP